MPKGKRWKTFQTVADGSKAAICGAVGGRVCDTRDTATPGDTMDGGAVKSCGACGRCYKRGSQGASVQQAPSTGDEDDEEPQTIG